MTETYVGWDGKPYPWPPPEGWYHASDGRWWAPGTGPNPPAQEQPPTALAPSQAARTADLSPNINTAAPGLGRPSTTPPHGIDQEADRATTVFTPTESGSTAIYHPPPGGQAPLPQQAPPAGSVGPSPQPSLGAPGRPAGYPDELRPVQQTSMGGGIFRALAIIVGIVAVVLAAGFAYFYLTAGQGADTASTQPAAQEANRAAEEPASDPTEDPPPAEASTTTSTLADPATTESSEPPDEEPTTTAPAPGDQVAQFRDLLEENDLTSDSLTDSQIRKFAEDFCLLASSAPDDDAFGEIREEAVEASESQLSNPELRLVINAAVVTFCPEEAARLGVEV